MLNERTTYGIGLNKTHNGRRKELSAGFVALLLFPFCPLYFSGAGFGNSVFTLLEVMILIVLVYFLVTLKRYDTIMPGIILLLYIAYEITYLFPAVFYGTLGSRSLYLWVKEFYSGVLLILLLSRFFQLSCVNTLEGIYRLLAFLAIVHVVLFYATGITLLGIRTRFADSTLIAAALLCVICFVKHRRPQAFDIFFIAACAVYVVEQWISTALVLFVLLMAAAFTCRFRVVESLCNYAAWVFTAVALNFSLVVLRVQNLFSWLLVDILHEDLTMDGRTWIWDAALEDSEGHIAALGAGIAPDGSKDIHVALFNEWGHLTMGDRQAHNQLVSVAYFNGLPGLLCYLGLIFAAGKNLPKIKDYRVAFILVIGMFLLCMGMCTELIADGYYFLMFLLAIYYAYLSEDLKKGDGSE